jgi:hypothetical protein
MARKKKELTGDDKILQEAIERYADCQPTCEEIYRDAVDDIEFSSGKQWSDDVTKDRNDRPCLTENRLAASVHQVCNSQRQNRPQIKVSAVDDTTDPDTAEVINGLLRHIQYNSDSETAFDTAFENAVRGGIGWYRVITEYSDDESFEEDIRVKRIENIEDVKVPFHLCKEIDCRDMPYAFIEYNMSKEEFENKWPDCDIENWKQSTAFNGWFTDKTVRVCEYFTIEEDPSMLYQLSDGTKTDVEPLAESGLTVIAKRKTFKRTIKWHKITANQILERTDFPGKWIPLIPVLGEEIVIRGKRKFLSFIKHAKDPQRMLNYWRSSAAERIALSAKAKWIAASNQIEKYSQEWNHSNRSNNPVLHYDPIVEGGILIPPPHQTAPIQADMAIIEAGNHAVDTIKACTGVYDASLGANGTEKSGVAIRSRQQQGDTSNYHFFDNFAKSLRHCGRIIVDIIPDVFDSERAVRILGEDMKQKIVNVNGGKQNQDGKLYDLMIGKYDVVVETGPSFQSKREEAAATIRDLSQNDPSMIPTTKDLLLKYLGMPQDLVERAARTVDPRLTEDNSKENPQQLIAQIGQAQQTIQQLDQLIQKMGSELEQAQSQLQGKAMDNQTRLQIAELQAQVQLLINSEKLNHEDKGRAHEVGLEAMRHVHRNIQGDLQAERSAMYQQPEAPAANAESNK